MLNVLSTWQLKPKRDLGDFFWGGKVKNKLPKEDNVKVEAGKIEGKAHAISGIVGVTSLLVPFFYINGYAFNTGFMIGFGADTELFAKSTPEYLCSYYDMLLYVYSSRSSGSYVLHFSLVLILIGVLMLLANICKSRINVHSKLIRVGKRNLINNLKVIFSSLFVDSMIVFFSVFFVFIIVIIPVTSYQIGREYSLGIVKDYSKRPKIHVEKMGKPFMQGYMIASRGDYSAIYDGEKTVTFKHFDGLTITSSPPQQAARAN